MLYYHTCRNALSILPPFEQYSKECEEKKTDLEPKVTEIYQASSTEIKALIKEPTDAAVKKHSAAVQKFLDELAKIDFPGSKSVSEAASKVGPAYVSGPVLFVFEKVSTFIPALVEEEKKKEEEKKEEAVPPPAEAEAESSKEEVKEKEIAVEAAVEEKLEDAPPAPAADPPKP
ncbi:hypothetical protein SASPL_117039 [Salvia splendens]|uniref:Plasma membrane-associated cation-binding protein 1 n=1 Tax=Salvia splendens TaxID=180675 RepID=A0A8X8ZXE2_SALSN|nr:hypothetical protein SASPL_117039 [Salvia splendens]